MTESPSDVSEIVGAPEGATHTLVLRLYLQCDTDDQAAEVGLKIRQKVAEIEEVMRDSR
jgi:hypothetical protein